MMLENVKLRNNEFHNDILFDSNDIENLSTSNFNDNLVNTLHKVK